MVPSSYNPSMQFLDSQGGDCLGSQKVQHKRPKPKFVYKTAEPSDSEEEEIFTATPANDVPKNKLVDKLVRGL